MLERRISNQRADLSNDQQMNYLLAWFNQWSDLEKEDFVPVLGETMSCKHANTSINGLSDSLSSLTTLQTGKRRPSLFDCQVSLYRDWVHGWSDDQKNYLILRLKDIDANFGKNYENFLVYGKASPEKDFFEPGIPPELDLSSEKNSAANSLNTSIDDDGRSLQDITFKVANNHEMIADAVGWRSDLHKTTAKQLQTDTKKDVEDKILSKSESTEFVLDEVSRKLTTERLESIEENAEYIHDSSGFEKLPGENVDVLGNAERHNQKINNPSTDDSQESLDNDSLNDDLHDPEPLSTIEEES